ncbi:MAG TPA: hypothetical protein PLM53_11910 [Spirochaetota bacterium]|nr:hypothetical protein [Spirochaetota bacterium]HPC39951.1 hypothetical protein [Spirochaetota bacterium]HPL19306.1 hypothetical protein [Spirochaetota bacterium]HQF10305.1 hypothetical protein [Spirochaetota bacterium]HQH97799.1 hypothetical protein [Spirochaetota bacterium]
MDDSVKKIFFYLGIVAALYLVFYYVLPLLVKLLAFIFQALFYIFIWGAVAFVAIFLVAHLVKIVRKEV